MDRYEVKSRKKPVDWVVEVPGSKSITNRALLIAALAKQKVRLTGVQFSDDSGYFLQALQDLGFQITVSKENHQVIVEGLGGVLPQREGEVYVGSAGTAARFLTAMLGVSDGTYIIRASEQMEKRPMEALFRALSELGCKVEWLKEPWHLPVRLHGAGEIIRAMDGPAVLHLDISKSTQFLSAFLLTAPMFPNGLQIVIDSSKKDGSYIRITRQMMEDFGVDVCFDGKAYLIGEETFYDRKEYRIEPDVSAACYFYAAAAVTGGRAKVRDVYGSSMQGDLKFLEVLKKMGCTAKETPDGICLTGPEGGKIHGVSVNMNDFSDQALTLAAIAPFADTPVWISGIAHIRGQESDRIQAICLNLRAAGIRCEEYTDGVTIYPGEPSACHIRTFEDHRVAMAFAVTGLRTEGIVIENPMCCRKTFADYFTVLDKLCDDPGEDDGEALL